MRITILGKNFEVSEYLRDMVEKRMKKLDKYFTNSAEAWVTLSVEHNSHVAEVTIPFEGGLIRAEDSTSDMYASVDNVLDKLEKQLLRYRAKRVGLKQRGETIRSDFLEAYDESDELDEEPKIVRVKHFAIRPMSEEEAMLQIEMLGHSFYVFENSDTGSVNVLYKRKDGNYGLIEPEK